MSKSRKANPYRNSSDSESNTSENINPFTRTIINIGSLIERINQSKEINHGICGGRNLGNTCYMNSSIACLSNCSELTEYFLSQKFKKDLNKSNKEGLGGDLALEWYSLLKEYWLSSRHYGDPSDLKRTIAKKNKKFGSYNQQDSNEFMTVFLETLGEDLNKSSKKDYEELDEQKNNESDLECAKRFWDLHIKRNNSIITDLFHGLFKNTITCPACGWKSITYDPFNTLTLPIPSIQRIQRIRDNKNKHTYADYTLFYVPNFGQRASCRVNIRVKLNKYLPPEQVGKRNLPMGQMANALRDMENFDYKPKKLDFMIVQDKNLIRYMEQEDQFDREVFIFASECDCKDKGSYSMFPLYFTLNRKVSDDKSAYPRNFYAPKDMTFDSFKRKIYLYVRRYITTTRRGEGDISDIEKELIKYLDSPKYSPEEEKIILNLLNKEYDDLVIKEKSSDFINSFPYQVLLYNTKSDSYSLLYNISNKIPNSNDLRGLKITRGDDSIRNLVEVAKKGEYQIVVELLTRTSKYLQPNINLNGCTSIQSKEIEEDRAKQNKLPDKILIDDCLDLLTSEELLEKGNEWKCKNCKREVKANKQLELFYLPKILCICLNRFKRERGYYNKNNSFIDFPIKDFNMGKYVVGPFRNNSTYDLYAVSQHYGGTDGGHYTAVCKNIDGKWYSYDDSSVSYINENRVVSDAGYVLFYRRKTN